MLTSGSLTGDLRSEKPLDTPMESAFSFKMTFEKWVSEDLSEMKHWRHKQEENKIGNHKE